MKYALACRLDQTVGWATADGSVTERASEAALFDSRDAAMAAKEFDPADTSIEEVPDEAAFRAMAPTWNERPLTLSALFTLAHEVMRAADNENLQDGGAGFHEKAQDLSSAAYVLLGALGHRDSDGRWQFGPAPAAA